MFQKLNSFILLLFVGLFSTQNIQAQYGNEWINSSQSYYKIPVAETGIYRLSYETMTTAGLPASTVNPASFQLFHRGIEQAINVVDGGDGVMNTGDYILFYGEKNDGTQDSKLYADPQQNLNPYYNLYSDTTAYFLTWGTTLGKRIEQKNETATTNASYFWQESLLSLSELYVNGQNYSRGSNNETWLSDFDAGEGWGSSVINTGNTRNFTLPILNVSTTSGQQAQAEIRLAGRSASGPNASLLINSNNIGLLSPSPSFKSTATYNLNFSPNLMGGTEVQVGVQVNLQSLSVGYIKLRYPQNLDLSNQDNTYLYVPATGTPGSATGFVLQNVPTGTVVYDISNEDVRQLQGNVTGSQISFVVPDSENERKLYLSTSFLNAEISPVNFQNLDPSLFDYLIVSHKQLRQSIANSSDVIQEYADYRSSVAGGSYEVAIWDIDILYDQFNYGEKSPLAIKNMAKYFFDNGTPQFLLLIGKGISFPNYTYFIGNPRQDATFYALDLVPPGGYPPSDVVYTTNIDPAFPQAPAIPTGRINATQAQEVLNYLNKVKEFEAVGNQPWKKDFVHLSGGNDEAEQQILRNYVDFFKTIAEGDFLKADVITYSKQTNEAVELINIAEEVNEGVGLITFFGHSAKTITDIEIGFASDDLQNYNNKERYPTILANGCELASIFYDVETLSEDWIYTADRGAIAFIGHSLVGFTIPLRRYSTFFYEYAFTDLNYIGKPIGNITQKIIQSYPVGINELDVSHTQQMILQGDPAIAVTGGNQVDYTVLSENTSLQTFDGSAVNASADSLSLQIAVANLGIALDNSFSVSVTRTLENGNIEQYFSSTNYEAIEATDTISFTIPFTAAAQGFNRFEIEVDYLGEISELDELNNIGIIDVVIPGAKVKPLLPANYAIVGNSTVKLSTIINEDVNPERQVIIELDTSYTFNSAAKTSITLPASQLTSWEASLLPNTSDTITYYWRSNYEDAINNPEALWGESSFTHIAGSNEGWGQMDFPQFRESDLELVLNNIFQKKWTFDGVQKSIEIETFGTTYPGDLTSESVIYYDGIPLSIGGVFCSDNTIRLVRFRQQNGDVQLVFGSNACGRLPSLVNIYDNNQILSENRLNTYIDAIPDGDYVALFTTGNINFDSWSNDLKNKLGELGANTTGFGPINTLANGHPYILFGQKGAGVGTAQEIISPSVSAPTSRKISLDTGIDFFAEEGKIISTVIGPASSWQSLHHTIVQETNDAVELDLIGTDLNGVSTTLQANITNTSLDLTSIDANQYPFLQLELTLKDDVDLTPAQLNNWFILYQGVAEGFLNKETIGIENYQISDKQEGETFDLEFAFENIQNVNYLADSLEVEYKIINQTQANTVTRTVKIPTPQANGTVRFSTTIETLGLAGENELQVFVNPRIVPEVAYDNNILVVPFTVIEDEIPPFVEVVVDGRQVLDGEIISPTPIINIRLTDNNPFIPVADTSGVTILFKKDCEDCEYEQLRYSSPNVRWVNQDGVTDVEYEPEKLEDGIYRLQVQGRDASNQLSGNNTYEISFEVINESSITHFYPYPNPFSTSTRFVFTLTGSNIPNRMKIQIMTVSGKVVREITKDELGPIHIGNNITEYAWDGRDEFGDQLANGVYLYRVLMDTDGQGFEHRTTAGDQAFKQGYGKMYILR